MSEPKVFDPRAFGIRLTGFRKDLQLSQRDLASRVGSHKDRICDLEAGLGEARVGELVSLATALGRSLDELVYGAVSGEVGELSGPQLQALISEVVSRGLQSLQKEARPS